MLTIFTSAAIYEPNNGVNTMQFGCCKLITAALDKGANLWKDFAKQEG